MADTRTITLVWNFEDKITPSLKKINELMKKIGGSKKKGRAGKKKNNFFDAKAVLSDIDKIEKGFKSIDKTIKALNRRKLDLGKGGLRAANEEAAVLMKQLAALSKKTEVNLDHSSIRAAQEEASVLDRMLGQKGEIDLDSSAIRAAQDEANILVSILQGAAAVKIGETIQQGLAAGTASATGTMMKGIGFVRQQLNAAAQDQLEDIQARGSLFGGLNKAKMFGELPAGADARTKQNINDSNYRGTKVISRVLENAMGEQITKSTNPTEVITMFQRQLTDNILPTVLKAQGIQNFDSVREADGTMNRDRLDALLVDSGTAEKMATLFDQMAAVSPQKAYAPVAARAYTEFLTTGKVNRRLGVFMNNPVLADALEEKGIAAGGDPAKLLEALIEGLEIAMPKAALMEAQTTFVGATQALSDTMMNATVGVLSFGAEVPNAGEKALAVAERTGAVASMEALAVKKYERAIERDKASLITLEQQLKSAKDEEDKASIQGKIDRLKKKIIETEKYKTQDLKKIAEDTSDYFINLNSPMEMLMGSTGGVIQQFAEFVGTLGNVWMPLTEKLFEKFTKPMADLSAFMDTITAEMEDLPADATFGERVNKWAEGLGKIAGKLFETVSQALFGLEGDIKNGGDLMDQVMESFMRGFEQYDGKKHLDNLLSRIQTLIEGVFFNKGKWYKGLSDFSWTLIKVFAVLAAPAAIAAALSGFVTIIGYTLGGAMVQAVNIAMGKLAINGATAGTAKLGLLPGLKDTLKGLAAPLKNLKEASKGWTSMRMANITSLHWTKSGIFMGNMMKGAQALGKWVPILAGVVQTLSKLLSGSSLTSALGSGVASGGGAMVGGAIGFALGGGPIGAMLGAAIGSQLGEIQQVVDFFDGAIRGIGSAFVDIGKSFSGAFVAIGSALGPIIKLLLPFPGMLEGVSQSANWVKAGFWAVKFALFPVVAGLQAIQVAAEVTALGFHGLRQVLNRVKIWALRLTGQDTTAAEAQAKILEQERIDMTNKLVDGMKQRDMEWGSWFDAGTDAMNRSAEAQAAAANVMREKAKNDFGDNRLGFVAEMGKYGGADKTFAEIERLASMGAISEEVANQMSSIAYHGKRVEETTKLRSEAEAKAEENVKRFGAASDVAKTAVAEAARATTENQTALAQAAKAWENSSVEVKTHFSLTVGAITGELNGVAAAIAAGRKKVEEASGPKVGIGQRILNWFKPVGDPGQDPRAGGIPKSKYMGNFPPEHPLMKAVAEEQKNKPAGSDLVIANSSETIIPAADGLNMGELSQSFSSIGVALDISKNAAVDAGVAAVSSVDTLSNFTGQGFTLTEQNLVTQSGAIQNLVGSSAESVQNSVGKAAEGVTDSVLASGDSIIKLIGNTTMQIISAVRSISMMGGGMLGGLMGGGAAAPAGLQALASSFGLTMTSFKRNGPANASYHNVGRAMDFSNGVNTPEMMQFAKALEARYGANLKELIYTPLGYSIKHGQRKAPIAAATHNNHVHVAWGMGAGNPAFFQDQASAIAWEKSVAKGNPIISSITARKDEIGTNQTNNINITIHQQPGQNADELAAIVADKISIALEDQISRTII